MVSAEDVRTGAEELNELQVSWVDITNSSRVTCDWGYRCYNAGLQLTCRFSTRAANLVAGGEWNFKTQHAHGRPQGMESWTLQHRAHLQMKPR